MSPCLSCQFMNDGCDIQKQVCRLVALLYPDSLNRKTLNHLMYEVR